MKPGYKQNNRGILALIVLLLTVGILAACGDTTPTNSPATTSAVTTVQAPLMQPQPQSCKALSA